MSTLDPEVKKQIERNHQIALERRAQYRALKQQSASSSEKRSSDNRFAPYPARPQPNNVLNTVTNNPVVTPKVPVPQNNQKAPSSMANGNNRYTPYGQSNSNARPSPAQQNQNGTASTSNKPSTSAAAAPPKKEMRLTLEIITDNRFQVRMSAYDDKVLSEIRKLPSKSWSKFLPSLLCNSLIPSLFRSNHKTLVLHPRRLQAIHRDHGHKSQGNSSDSS